MPNNFETIRLWTILQNKLNKKITPAKNRADLSVLKTSHEKASKSTFKQQMENKLQELKKGSVLVEVRNSWELAVDVKMVLGKGGMGGNQNSHKWTVHFQQLDSEKQMFPIQNVEFYLHPSFNPNHIVIDPPGPYRITRLGWGTFSVPVVVNFDPIVADIQIQIYHELVFGPGGSPVGVFRIDLTTGECFDTKTNKKIWPKDEPVEVAVVAKSKAEVNVKSKSKVEVNVKSKSEVNVKSKAKAEVNVSHSKKAAAELNFDEDDSDEEQIHIEKAPSKEMTESMNMSKVSQLKQNPPKKSDVQIPQSKVAPIMSKKQAPIIMSKKAAPVMMPSKKAAPVMMPSKKAAPDIDFDRDSSGDEEIVVAPKK